MLSKEELRAFSKISGWRSTLALLLDWAGIAALLALVIRWPHPVTFFLAFILIGRQQLALAILMHDGAHGRLYRSPLTNDVVGQIFTGAPLFFSQDSYRKFHLKHHLSPLAADDPDLSLIGGYPIGRGSFVRKLLRDLFGVSYFKFIGYFFYKPRKPKSGAAQPKPKGDGKRLPLWFQAASVIAVNSVFFGLLWYAGHPWYFFFFWFLPMMTILQVLLRIRGIAEHAGYRATANQMLCSRTVVNPVQTFFFAPHQVNYHMEHHQYPSVPFYRLPRVHRLMVERESLPSQNVFTGYGRVISELIA